MYLFVADYASHLGMWHEGDVVELPEDTAAWINRDCGQTVVVPFVEADTSPDPIPGRQDRMQRRPSRKRGE